MRNERLLGTQVANVVLNYADKPAVGPVKKVVVSAPKQRKNNGSSLF
jgi:hypothetical protein